jgi:hypothetical protein
MTTFVRTGRNGHRVRDVTTWCICPPTEPSKEERERIAREDAEIAAKRAAFPLH